MSENQITDAELMQAQAVGGLFGRLAKEVIRLTCDVSGYKELCRIKDGRENRNTMTIECDRDMWRRKAHENESLYKKKSETLVEIVTILDQRDPCPRKGIVEKLQYVLGGWDSLRDANNGLADALDSERKQRRELGESLGRKCEELVMERAKKESIPDESTLILLGRVDEQARVLNLVREALQTPDGESLLRHAENVILKFNETAAWGYEVADHLREVLGLASLACRCCFVAGTVHVGKNRKYDHACPQCEPDPKIHNKDFTCFYHRAKNTLARTGSRSLQDVRESVRTTLLARYDERMTRYWVHPERGLAFFGVTTGGGYVYLTTIEHKDWHMIMIAGPDKQAALAALEKKNGKKECGRCQGDGVECEGSLEDACPQCRGTGVQP